jgi:lipoprotein-anchoring transpeptidase ErfK/SrfK
MTHFAEGTSPRQFISSPASEPAPTGLFHDLLSINGHGTFAATHGALIVGVCALCRLVAAKSCLQKITLRFGVGGGLRVGVRSVFVIVALIAIGSIGSATAQGYYPPPPGYYPPPPGYYPPPPGYYPPPPGEYYPPPADYYPPPPSYARPVPPRDVGASSPDPSYNSAYQQGDTAPPHYPPGTRPYYAPPDQAAAQPPAPDVPRPPGSIGTDVTGSINAPTGSPDRAATTAGLPPEYQAEHGPAVDLPQQFHRQLVDYVTTEPAGTIIIDTAHTYLYLVLGPGKALRYGVGVGREGFTWAGTERISHRSEWPDWHPPKEMIERQPYLPRFMAGGEGNPLGARALYLGNTIYRIHGTNQPSTIGHFVSSGCIRLTNEDITDLYSRVNIGTRVVVLPGAPSVSASAQTPVAR